MEITITLHKLGVLDRVWYWYIKAEPPVATSVDKGRLARLVPYQLRSFHKLYARAYGYFWLPCPLCDQCFGGHEFAKSIPDPTGGPTSYIGICSKCSRKRT